MWDVCKFKVFITSVLLVMLVLCLTTGLLLCADGAAADAVKYEVDVKLDDTRSLKGTLTKSDTGGKPRDSRPSSELQSTPLVVDTLSSKAPPSVSTGSNDVFSALTNENTSEIKNTNISETSPPSQKFNVESSEFTTAPSLSLEVETLETKSPTRPHSSAVGETITLMPTIIPTAPSVTTPSITSTSSTQVVKSEQSTPESSPSEAESSQSLTPITSYSLETILAGASPMTETTRDINESASKTNTNPSTEHLDMATGSTIVTYFNQNFTSESSNQSLITKYGPEAVNSSSLNSVSPNFVLQQNISTYSSTFAQPTVGIETRLGTLSHNEGREDSGVDRRKHRSGDKTLTAGQKTALAVCITFVSMAAVFIGLTLYRRRYQIGNWKLLNKSMRYKPWSYANGTYQDDVL